MQALLIDSPRLKIGFGKATPICCLASRRERSRSSRSFPLFFVSRRSINPSESRRFLTKYGPQTHSATVSFISKITHKKLGPASYGTIEPEQNSNSHAMDGTEPPAPAADSADSKLSLLFTSRLMSVLVNYAFLAILEHSQMALEAVFLATPITSGGLGLSPSHIGIILGTTGFVHGVLQTFCFAPLYRTFDPKNLYTFCMSMSIPVYACFPGINALARIHGLAYPGVWVLLVFQLSLLLPSYTAFSACFCPS